MMQAPGAFGHVYVALMYRDAAPRTPVEQPP
jgi:hypothetical protein